MSEAEVSDTASGLPFELWEGVVYGGLLLVILYLLKEILFPKKTPPPTFVAAKKIEPRDYTLDELKGYDGSDPDKPILFAADGKIYDVSRGKQFYGKGGPYNVFTGGDASRCLALGSTEQADMDNPSVEGLDLEPMYEWIRFFQTRYDVVGNLVLSESEKIDKSQEKKDGSSAIATEQDKKDM
eukprot:TRINITY_DN12241_c0_g1_i2.p1 TRINITY_DN12241_c0_g1~~TRINITY_DN12241_c0_g1_i2.p1  ORF type:complete len:183 (-),score=48.11 TRINITY_DN12241_c0_g1_i2:23-571(-)